MTLAPSNEDEEGREWTCGRSIKLQSRSMKMQMQNRERQREGQKLTDDRERRWGLAVPMSDEHTGTNITLCKGREGKYAVHVD